MKAVTRRKRVNKALEEMPVGRDFLSTDIEEIMNRQYKVSTLTPRAIGFILGKLPNVRRIGRANGQKNLWRKIE